jgi:S1-C subfamily serine protease
VTEHHASSLPVGLDAPVGPDDANGPDGPHGPASPGGPAGTDPPDTPEDPDDLAGFQTTMSRVFGRLRIVLGIVVALAMLLPAGGWVLDRLAVRSAGGDVQEALGDDADITDSLLLVRSVDCAGRSRSGSAFSLDLDGAGVVITNRHVVDAARSTVVQPLDAGPGTQVRQVLLSAAADVAVLVLDDEAVPPTLATGPTASLGQSILTVGFPGARPALREGRVDRVEPTRLLLALEVGAGASGSPVLDDEGRVVGQVFARTQDGRGVATPIEVVVAAVGDATPAPTCP